MKSPDYVKRVEFCPELGIIFAEMNRPGALAFFSICAVVDFGLGYMKWHTFGAGIVAIFCGLPLTGLLFLCFRGNDSGAPRS